MKKSDATGIFCGAGCLVLAYLDSGAWKIFWLVSGGILLVWSLWTAITGK